MMIQLNVNLKNCYGIQSMEHVFDFGIGSNTAKPKTKAYAVYAPNGLMKSSFAKTFDVLSKDESPKEERYNRPSTCVVESDGVAIPRETIYVLKAEIDISADSPAITDILVNPENKAKYDELLVSLDKLKSKLFNALQKASKIKKDDIERTILKDWSETDFPTCLGKIKAMVSEDDLTPYEYATIFDPKATDVLKSEEFVTNATEFNERYQDLFNQAGTIYQKGVFNPTKAETSFSTLNKQGFFAGGHRIHLRGEASSIDKAELDKKLQEIHASIDGDDALKKLRTSLAKNAQTQALTDLIERLSPSEIEFFLEKMKPENHAQFRKELWVYYVQNSADTTLYLDSYTASKDEIESIEAAAAQAAPRWVETVRLFNDRFVDMPFTLSVANQTQAALGKENARLKFTCNDGADTVEWSRAEIRTLSQGEKRALYLLNFIFEVEARKLANQETLFIIDDVADSFDYKNKHAIVQYLDDLSKTEFFYQIILTHNFDFFRTLCLAFVPYDRCLMANRGSGSIGLAKAEGIKNYFIGKWKDNVADNDCILCATIPFTRNLIEYTKGEQDPHYLKLTSLLHWKDNTEQVTVGDYLDIYNRLFGTTHDTCNTQSVKDLLFTKAGEICVRNAHDGLNLEDKVLLSMAIRLQAEIFVTKELRVLKNDATYWCQANNQFGSLMKEYASLAPAAPERRTLEKVSITVSSNIHLNSFMYEPILDLTVDHLVNLYQEVRDLHV
ncbi:AAA family ATPase [Haliea sp. E1-2-M8]|uniref:AAA family ATPase n=1 Tax=Haliea sp. E1-2-M8 TaxID=3064706 RepID=UPI00271A1EAE|nr:AAA family ATPase [Haliea sp. E1-2-M8]MDO8863296.1 AAA family ATPase [Haliea sp. E1-2-M8]